LLSVVLDAGKLLYSVWVTAFVPAIFKSALVSWLVEKLPAFTPACFTVIVPFPISSVSAFQFQVFFSAAVTNLLVVSVSSKSSGSNTTAPVLLFTLVTPPTISKSPVPKILCPLTVLILVPLTKRSCFQLQVFFSAALTNL